MPRVLRRLIVALATLIAAGFAVLAAWGIDLRGHDGKVMRGVTLAGRPIGNLTEQQVTRVVGEVAVEFPGQKVEVRAPGGGFTAEARAFGLRVSERATVRAAMRVGREGPVPVRLAEWMRSFRGGERAPVRVALDRRAVFSTVAAMDPGPRKPPEEPGISYAKGEFAVVEGKPGEGIDPLDVMSALPRAADVGDTIVVEVDRGEVPPRYSTEDAKRLAEAVEAKVSSPLPVSAGGTKATVPVATLRSWIRSTAGDDGLEAGLDGKAALADLRKLLQGAGEPSEETRFVVDGGVRIIPGKAGTQCCAEGATQLVEREVLRRTATGPHRAVDLPLTERPPALSVEEAQRLGISEAVASFTTKHKGGEPRVRNIHRIADMLRGTVIRPGQTFSVNDTVGRRTPEKGFVNAPVIEDGKFSESIGGGISQFATTLFNSAFLGGLEFAEYQSHSIYISRYPYGREATLSYPHPDLKIRNPTPHGILIWPTYTGTTITVTLYSTKYVEVAQTGQSEAPRGACKRVTTQRTRTYIGDGRKETDTVSATYRPAEGVNC